MEARRPFHPSLPLCFIIKKEWKMNKVDTVSSKDKVQPVVVVDGKTYPCDLTMGALLRYKREEGEEIHEIEEGEVCKMMTLMWCCVKSSCSRDKVNFDMSLEEFADNVNPQDVADWAGIALFNKADDEAGDGEEEEKKA